jgi:hypothetical protein
MATPHVAGAFALLRSLVPAASVDQIEQSLKATGLAVSGVPRIRLLDAARQLQAAPSVAAPATTDGLQAALAQLASLPPDEPVRLIVRAADVSGAQGQAAAASAVQNAARAAGITTIQPLAQGMFVVEATPAQARALANSGAISSMQPDRAYRTQ